MTHGHSIWPNWSVSFCGKSKGSHLRGTNVPMCSPFGRRAKGSPFLPNPMAIPNHTRFIPESCASTKSPTHPTSGWFGGACRGPLVCTVVKGSCLWWGLGSLVDTCICLVCPATNRYCLPTASWRRCGPTAGSPANPTIHFQSCESYPRTIHQAIPSNHTTYSNFPARLR